jgi:hypothetical protein
LSQHIDEEKEECNCFSIQQKIQYVEFAMSHMDDDLASLHTIANQIGVSSSSLSMWMNKLPMYRHIVKHDHVRYSLNASHCGQLDDIGPELFGFVKDLRENGYAVSKKMIVVQACKILGSDSAFL